MKITELMSVKIMLNFLSNLIRHTMRCKILVLTSPSGVIAGVESVKIVHCLLEYSLIFSCLVLNGLS
jgi:hypothetical protein